MSRLGLLALLALAGLPRAGGLGAGPDACSCRGDAEADRLWRDLLHTLGQGQYPMLGLPPPPLPTIQPRCGVVPDKGGRLHFKLEEAQYGLPCPAAMAAEAAVCALSMLQHQKVAFMIQSFLPLLFIDLALAKAAAAGAECFDQSRWGLQPFGFAAGDLLWWHGSTLRKAMGGIGSFEEPAEGVAVNTSCPPEPQAQAEVAGAANRPDVAPVSCLVPLVWPAQRPNMEAIMRTYGTDCDDLQFFIAAEGEPARRELDGAEIINLHAVYPDKVPPDRTEFHREVGAAPAKTTSNTIVKLLHMLLWSAEDDRGRPHWHCRLERDTYFLPENFRLLVASLGLDAADPHYLGVREFNDVPRSGLIYNDGGPGICLSSTALDRLHAALTAAPTLPEDQPLDFEECAFALGHREDIMLAICLRLVGVHPSPLTTDARGREWFSIRPLRAIPQHGPPRWRDERGEDAFSWNFWTGRAHLFLPCWSRNPFWVVDTPVSFNSFKNVSMFEDAYELLSAPLEQRRAALGGYPARLSGLRRLWRRALVIPASQVRPGGG